MAIFRQGRGCRMQVGMKNRDFRPISRFCMNGGVPSVFNKLRPSSMLITPTSFAYVYSLTYLTLTHIRLHLATLNVTDYGLVNLFNGNLPDGVTTPVEQNEAEVASYSTPASPRFSYYFPRLWTCNVRGSTTSKIDNPDFEVLWLI